MFSVINITIYTATWSKDDFYNIIRDKHEWVRHKQEFVAEMILYLLSSINANALLLFSHLSCSCITKWHKMTNTWSKIPPLKMSHLDSSYTPSWHACVSPVEEFVKNPLKTAQENSFMCLLLYLKMASFLPWKNVKLGLQSSCSMPDLRWIQKSFVPCRQFHRCCAYKENEQKFRPRL